jgi:predicted nucleotide-binding protein
MKSVVDELYSVYERCTAAAEMFGAEPLSGEITALREACTDLYSSWSESWIGYQACVYLEGFVPRPAHFFFDKIDGLESSPFNKTKGPWREYTYDEVVEAIKGKSHVKDFSRLGNAAIQARRTFDENKEDLLPTLAALAHERTDQALQELNAKLSELKSSLDPSSYIQARRGNITQPISDRRALGGGVAVPPHIQFEAWVLQCSSHRNCLLELANLARRTARYLERINMTKQASRPDSKRVFIGHGGSNAWTDLRDLLCNRLGLEYEEFNRESTPGLSVKERLIQMLDACNFAFLILSAEDEHRDGTHHARENVLHELGLTQGRYGFERAIVLMEDGCAEFSNIHGLIQIRFPRGDIAARSEQIRRVLEREGLLSPTARTQP